MNNDDGGFDDVAFRAGRGLGSIGSTQPPLASVRRRVAARRVATMSTVAAVAAVAVVAVNAQLGSKPTPTIVDVASSSATGAPNVSSSDPVATTASTSEVTSTTTPTTAAPTTTAPVTTAPAQLDITVAEPRSGAVVSAAGPLVVRGDALTFESTVNIKVYDVKGDLVVETFTTAASPDAVPGPYSISIAFPTPVAHLGTGRLEVFEYSAKDGTEIHKVTVPITFVSAG